MRKLVLALALLSALAIAQKEDSIFVRKIAHNILVNGRAFEQLRYLTKKIGGRLAGSPQMTMAENWGLTTLKESGADNVFLQECMVPHWVRGGEDKAAVIDVAGCLL